MKIHAIVYTSSTGHTRRYAEKFGEMTGLPVYPMKKAKWQFKKNANVIYFGWVMAGKIKGYEKAWKKWNVPCCCSVGLYPDSDRFREYLGKGNILIDVKHFHLRGGITPDKLNKVHKLLMEIIMKSLRIKIQKGEEVVTKEELDALDAYDSAADFVDEEALAPVLAWYEFQKQEV